MVGMTEVVYGKILWMLNKIMADIKPENTIKLSNNSSWVTLHSKSGSVEGKIYFPATVSDKLVILEPGFPGGVQHNLNSCGWIKF